MIRPSMHSYFDQLVYAAANEDTRSELQALRLSDSDEVLCITGSGARPLELLLGKPQRIVSVDLNPNQNHLLKLKIGAMQTMSHDEYLAFLGVTDHMTPQARCTALAALSPSLEVETAAFWSERKASIARGIIYQGTWEKNLKAMARASWFRRSTLARLMQCESTAEQRAIWQDSWDDRTWRTFLRALSSRFLWRYIAREPGINVVPKDFDIGASIYESLDLASRNILFSRSAFAHLMFHGRYDPARTLPLHLRAEHFETIRNHAHNIEVVTADLQGLLRQDQNISRFTGFSLSDFSTYCLPSTYAAIWRHVAQAAAPGARFCERQLFVKLDPTQIANVSVKRDHDLEAKLRLSDDSIFYTFVCGVINAHDQSVRH